MGYNLLVNGVYWGYNPLTNHLLTSWDILVWPKINGFHWDEITRLIGGKISLYLKTGDGINLVVVCVLKKVLHLA